MSAAENTALELETKIIHVLFKRINCFLKLNLIPKNTKENKAFWITNTFQIKFQKKTIPKFSSNFANVLEFFKKKNVNQEKAEYSNKVVFLICYTVKHLESFCNHALFIAHSVALRFQWMLFDYVINYFCSCCKLLQCNESQKKAHHEK